ncbi:MAG: BatA domain-containing protein, partial [Candidatus Latescibacteria bacterium]|nr:BatA domain-containing protein [Candidatus Latescibacterota bacterium]
MQNIAFLNPAVLPALTVALLPILIHLLTRRKLKKVAVSSVVFLQQLQKKRMRRIKVRQWLLLVLRTLIIIFLILAFSRPVLRTTLSFVGSSTPTTAAILLDNSYSMGFETPRGRLFDLSKQRVLELIGLLKPGDEVVLLPFADRPPVAKQWKIEDGESRFSLIRDFILNLQLSCRATDVSSALEKASKLLSGSGNPHKEIFLFTDMEENGRRGLQKEKVFAELKGISLYLLPVEAVQEENVSVERVTVPKQILSVKGQIELEVQVTNYRKSDIRDLLLCFYLDGERLSQVTLNIRAGQTKRVLFQVVPEKTGVLSGYVEIEPDRLSVDNRRYFSVSIPAGVKVLLVGNKEADTYFLNRALNPSGSKEAFMQTASTTGEKISLQQIEENDVIILANVQHLNQWQVEQLRASVNRGKGLLICLGPQVDKEFYNRQLFPRFSQIKLGELLGIAGGKSSYYSFGKINFSHPVLKGLLQKERMDSPRFYSIYQTVSSPQVEPIVWYNQGSPALCESQLGKGRIILFTSAVDPEWTDLPVKGIFVPLFYRIVQYLATALPEELQRIGEPIERTFGELESPVECQDPMGNRVSLFPVPWPGGMRWCLSEVEVPGIWRLFSQNREVEQIAVNVDARESTPQRI